jgi:hypothetical protein
MAVDRGYGTGKPLSAAQSAARRTKAASANLRKKNIKRVASKPFQRQIVASVGKQAAAGFNIGGRQYLESGVSPWKALSMYTSRVARFLEQGEEIATLTNVARRAPRSPVAQRAQRGVGAAALDESNTLLRDVRAGNPLGYSSTMFPDHVMHLFRADEVRNIYRAAAKIAGKEGLKEAGKNLRYVSRKGYR